MKQRKLRKPSSGPTPPLTRLKELPAADRMRVMELLNAGSYSTAASDVQKFVGFACSVDCLSKFYSWQLAQEDLESSNDLVSQFEGFCKVQNPDWSEDRVRNASIGFFMAHATAKRDIDGFVSVAKLGLDAKKSVTDKERLALERDKFEFNAAEACLKQLPSLKAISSNKTLTEPEKVEQIRLKLFGQVPAAK